MRVLVAVKRVVDFNTRVRVMADGSGVDLSAVKMALNPFCEIALEEAIRLRERKAAGEVVAVTVGPKASAEALRTALALGADRAVHVVTGEKVRVAPLGVARVLQVMAERETPSLVLLGKQAIDDDTAATGQLLAGLLRWPQATAASKIEVVVAPGGDGGGESSTGAPPPSLRVTREVDGGLQEVVASLPAVVTADLRLNTPRYATLPNIMKAKKKKIEEVPAEDLDLDLESKLEVVSVSEPTKRPPGIMVGSVEELVQKLREAEAI